MIKDKNLSQEYFVIKLNDFESETVGTAICLITEDLFNGLSDISDQDFQTIKDEKLS